MNLILREEPLGFFRHGRKGEPGVAVTFATAGGEIRPASAVITGIGCRVRYEIDMSDHRDEVDWALPSKDERMFVARIGVGWRVFDPCEVTSRRIQDGFNVLQGYLHPVVRRLSRVLEVERLHDLEDQINGLVTAGPARFTEGLEVYHVDAQVGLDESTASHAASLRAKDRDRDIQSRQHLVDITVARSQIDIDTLRRRAIEQMVAGENGLLLHHLTVHRDDTMGVLHALQQQDKTSAEARARLLEQFKDRLLPEELDGLAELLIRHTRDAIERPGSPPLVQPHVPPAIVSGESVSVPALPGAPATNQPEPLRTTPTSNGSAAEPPSPTPPTNGANVAEWQPVRRSDGGDG